MFATNTTPVADVNSHQIVETSDSIYEIDDTTKRFRLIHTFAPSSDLIVGQWQFYQRMSTVTIDEPITFCWLLSEAGQAARIGFLTTNPVIGVIDDGAHADVA